MKSKLKFLTSIICLSALPVIASYAQDGCFATINLSVQQTITDSGYDYVNANYTDIGQGDNYSDTVSAGQMHSLRVPCGTYIITATPVIGKLPIAQPAIVSQNISGVGKCTIKEGTQLGRDGTSVSVTFPDDFICTQ